jgi:hypothetical protein
VQCRAVTFNIRFQLKLATSNHDSCSVIADRAAYDDFEFPAARAIEELREDKDLKGAIIRLIEVLHELVADFAIMVAGKSSARQEIAKVRWLTFNIDLNSIAVIEYLAAKRVIVGEREYERTESDSLNNSSDSYFPTSQHPCELRNELIMQSGSDQFNLRTIESYRNAVASGHHSISRS